MNAETNVKRTYESRLRTGQARTTRRALLEAAGRLFAEQGYVATSIEQVAEAAGVSRATVFTSVGGKPALLKAAYDVALVGDDELVPMPDRPDALRTKAEPDPYKYLVMYAGLVTGIHGRIARINEAIRGAAGADPEARALWEKVQSERAVGALHVVEFLEQKGRLRPGLDRAEAIDVVWTLIEPGLYFQLVHQRAWTAERFQAWLTDTFHAQLLPPRRRRSRKQ